LCIHIKPSGNLVHLFYDKVDVQIMLIMSECGYSWIFACKQSANCVEILFFAGSSNHCWSAVCWFAVYKGNTSVLIYAGNTGKYFFWLQYQLFQVKWHVTSVWYWVSQCPYISFWPS
jgi:hypothetical protein